MSALSPSRVAAEACAIPTYEPSVRWRGGHWMTVYVWARRRRLPHLPPAEPRYFEVAPDACVLAECHWQADRSAHPTLLALHGLEGSSGAHYMRGLADKAFARGFNVVRLNQRNCGGTEALSRGLYHSGLTDDAHLVIDELTARDGMTAVVVAGYSLGGNLALKLAGELGAQCSRPTADAPGRVRETVRAVCAISPTMDLSRCVAALERRENAVYQWNFMRHLKARLRRKARLFPGLYDTRPLRGMRTIRAFDDQYTAPHHGFRDAADYYTRASALRVVDRIRLPTLIVSAEDDPFVPVEQFRHPAITTNPWMTVLLPPHGGHCAFLAEAATDFDGYWAEQAIVEWAAFHTNAERRRLVP